MPFNKVAGSSAALLWNPAKANSSLKFYDGNQVAERPGNVSVRKTVYVNGFDASLN
jgi:hypothetical protein